MGGIRVTIHTSPRRNESEILAAIRAKTIAQMKFDVTKGYVKWADIIDAIARCHKFDAVTMSVDELLDVDTNRMSSADLGALIAMLTALTRYIDFDMADFRRMTEDTMACGLPYVMDAILHHGHDDHGVYDMAIRYCTSTERAFRVQLLLIAMSFLESVGFTADGLADIARGFREPASTTSSGGERPAPEDVTPLSQE